MWGGLRLFHELETILFGMNLRRRNINMFFSGIKYHSIERELKTIRMTLGTVKEMEKEWMIAGQSHKNQMVDSTIVTIS